MSCTIARNVGLSGGGGIFVTWLADASTVALRNTIVARNCSGSFGDPGDDWGSESNQLFCDLKQPNPAWPVATNCAFPGSSYAKWNPAPAHNVDIATPFFLDDGEPLDAGMLSRDFHLASCSPCRDLGSSASLPLDLFDADDDSITIGEYLPDADREARVAESNGFGVPEVDIGALEHGAVCGADTSGDGQVGGADLANLLGAWGTCNCGGDMSETPTDCHCSDFDDDCEVGAADLAILLGAWGDCPGGGDGMMMMAGEAESLLPTPGFVASLFGFDSLGEFAAWMGELDQAQRAQVASLFAGEGAGL